MRSIALLVAATLIATACSAGGATVAGEGTVPDEPAAAPDFSLTLADGGLFRLSDEQKPVYMIFWADW